MITNLVTVALVVAVAAILISAVRWEWRPRPRERNHRWGRTLALLLLVPALMGARLDCSTPPPSDGGGSNSRQDDRSHVHHMPTGGELAFIVEWDPDQRAVDISWKIGKQVAPPFTMYRQPFIKDFVYTADDVVSVTAHQHAQGWLRCAIDSPHGELTHQVTNAYDDTVTCSFNGIIKIRGSNDDHRLTAMPVGVAQ